MRWKVLALGLGVVLISALLFAVFGARAPAGTSGGQAGDEAPPEPTPWMGSSRAAAPPAGSSSRPPPSQPAATDASSPAAPSSSIAAPAIAPGSNERNGGDAAVPFPITQHGLRAAFAEKLSEIRDCYEPWLKANPSLAGGSVTVSLTIDRSPDSGAGVTRIGVVDGGLDHFALQGCLMNVFQELTFEAPTDGVVNVIFPLTFALSPDDAGE